MDKSIWYFTENYHSKQHLASKEIVFFICGPYNTIRTKTEKKTLFEVNNFFVSKNTRKRAENWHKARNAADCDSAGLYYNARLGQFCLIYSAVHSELLFVPGLAAPLFPRQNIPRSRYSTSFVFLLNRCFFFV